MSARELITEHLDLWTGAVTKKSSSGRGSNGKVELTGVKKLRELILELAVRGKLVEQDPTDEPAEELLLKVYKENEASSSKKSKTSEFTTDDAPRPYSVPRSWAWAHLGDLFDIVYGKGLPKSKLTDEGYEVFGANGIIGKYTEYTYEHPQLLISCRGAYSGKANISPAQCFITSNTLILRNCWSYLTLQYFYYALTVADKSKIVTGSAQPQVTTANLSPFLVAVPPLEEQHRIVQKVDELMALCDRLEQQTSDQLEAHETLVDTLLGTLTQSENATQLADNWARLAAHFDTLFTTEQSIDKLKQTVLQLAVMGRLVEQDSGDESTTQLLERVSNEKQRLIQSKVLKQTKSLAPLDTSALPSIPEGWSWVNLGDIISVMDAGWSPACPPRPADPEKWGVLKTTAVQVMKYQELENKQLPDNKAPKEQYEVRSGDILITRAGPKNRVGISCVVKETRDKLMISDKIIRFHLIETGLSEEYICLCLNAGETYNYLEQAKSGMAESQMNISQDKLKAAPIPLCPANEQHRIVQKVDELMALCDQLKQRLNQASETRCQLAEAVVEGALN